MFVKTKQNVFEKNDWPLQLRSVEASWMTFLYCFCFLNIFYFVFWIFHSLFASLNHFFAKKYFKVFFWIFNSSQKPCRSVPANFFDEKFLLPHRGHIAICCFERVQLQVMSAQLPPGGRHQFEFLRRLWVGRGALRCVYGPPCFDNLWLGLRF